MLKDKDSKSKYLNLDIANIDVESWVKSQEKGKETRMTEALNNLEDYLTLMHYNIKPYASSDRSSLCHHLLKDRKYFYQIELKQQAGAFWNIELLIHFWLKKSELKSCLPINF